MHKYKVIFLLLLNIQIYANCIPINIMTYNVHYGMNTSFTNRDNNSSLDQILTYIKNKNLDLIFLQEFPQGKKEYASYLHGKRKDALPYIKNKLKNKFYIEDVITRDGNIYKGGKRLIIISKYKVLEKHILNLPNPKWNQIRKAILVKLDIKGRKLWAVTTHTCSQKNKKNLIDLKSVLLWLDKKININEPIIFCGDFNFDSIHDTNKRYNKLTKRTNGAIKYNMILEKGFLDSKTTCKQIKEKHKNTFIYSNRRVDYIFYKNLECFKYYDDNSTKSDHYPIFSNFCLK